MRFGNAQLTKYREALGKRMLTRVVHVFEHYGVVSMSDQRAILQWVAKQPEILTESWVYAGVARPQEQGAMLCFDLCIAYVALTGNVVQFTKNTMLYSWWLNTTLPPGILRMIRKDEMLGCELHGEPTVWIPSTPQETVGAGVRLMKEDHNPFNKHNAHPDVEFVPYDLGGVDFSDWKKQFADAFVLIQETTGELYAIMEPFLDSLVPMGYVKERQLSSSYKETPGILYLSYTETVLKQAEALVHEIHHTIFNAVDAITPVLENDLAEAYISGYRPDPRHIRGCFLGLHAFSAVEVFYWEYMKHHQDQGNMQELLATIHNQNMQTLETIEQHGKLTKYGTALLNDAKEYLNKAAESYQALPAHIRKEAEQVQLEHGKRVQKEIDKNKI